MQKWLQRWINNYVDGNPDHSTETVKAQKPLRDARVVVEEIKDNPGYYTPASTCGRTTSSRG